LKANDVAVLEALDRAAVSYAIVLTKSDRLKPAELKARIAETATAIGRRPAAFPVVFPTSAHAGSGLPELRAAIARVVAERASLD
jgi:GTP-binding protein